MLKKKKKKYFKEIMTGSFANFMKDSENRKAQQNPNGEIHKNYVHAHHNQMAKNKIQRKTTREKQCFI